VLGTPSSIPEVSDGVAVPANRAVAAEEAARRADIAYHPYHRELSRRLELLNDPFVVAMHSCTPIFAPCHYRDSPGPNYWKRWG